MCPGWRRETAAIAAVFCVTLAGALLVCTRARAEAELDLQWRAEAPCPDASWALQRIASQLGRALSSQASATLRARVQITGGARAFRLSLRTQRGASSGERSVEDASCEDLAEAATLMIALAIDSRAVLEAQTQLEVGAAATPTAASDFEKPPFLRAPAARDPEAQRWADRGLRARVGLLADVGFLPALGLGPELMLGISRAHLAAELGGYWLPAQSSRGTERVSVALWAVAGRGCAHWASAAWLVGGCLGSELGRTSAEGHGLRPNLHTGAPFAALTATLRARLRLVGPLWLVLEPGLALPLLRQRFVALDTTDDSRTALHAPRALSARGSLGVELSF